MGRPDEPGIGSYLVAPPDGGTNGVTGGWGFVRGAMRALSEAIARSARDTGVEIRTGAEVVGINVTAGRVTGVILVDGTEFRSRMVVSGIYPHTTLLSLVGRKHLPAELAAELDRYRNRSASAKVNFALSELPNLTARPGKEPGPQHPEIMISPSLEYLEKAWDAAKYGRFSERPMIDAVIPTTKDPTLAPEGKHIMTCFVQYVPYRLKDESWENGARDKLAGTVVETISEYAPNFRDSIIHRQVLTPYDLERHFGLIGGNIFHEEMALDQLFSFRPAPGLSGYRMPISGLYMCGFRTHPGGGVMGIPGFNASRVAIRDAKSEDRRKRLQSLSLRSKALGERDRVS